MPGNGAQTTTASLRCSSRRTLAPATIVATAIQIKRPQPAGAVSIPVAAAIGPSRICTNGIAM
jgi:hypothetical protein